MTDAAVFIDNHSTTRVDPRVIEVMLPFFSEHYANAGSISHEMGMTAREAVENTRLAIANSINANEREIIFTSGATESNNLAIRGVAEHRRRKGNHIVSVTTEHKAVIDPVARLERRDFSVTWLTPETHDSDNAGRIDVQNVADALTDDTFLVSIMMANNEIGVIQPIAEIGELCKERGVLFLTDATQAVGKIPVDVEQLNVDLMSFSAHKIYGPKGVGALYVGRRSPQVRIAALTDGGGQERGMRSGTLNVSGIAGFGKALELCLSEMDSESVRLQTLRQMLFAGLKGRIENVRLNGPRLDDPKLRLTNNLNVRFEDVDGEALMMNMKGLAVSSGSACTSASPEPSHVLQAIGLSEDQTRSSLRFGLGRFNTQADIEFAIETVAETVAKLRAFGSTKY